MYVRMDKTSNHLYWKILPFLLLVSASCEECDPVQYLEYGTTSTLECSFRVDFYSVLWYESGDYITTKPIVTLQEGRVIHNDPNSYEYDITVDGSLVINYVNLSHEHQFLAIKFDRNGAEPSYHYIHAIVSVSPHPRYPVVDGCSNESSLCFKEAQFTDAITCSVNNSRPKIDVLWSLAGNDGDIYIKLQSIQVIDHGISLSSSSSVQLHALNLTSLSLLVCRAFDVNKLLVRDESLVLVQSSFIDYTSQPRKNIFVERNSNLVLQCGHQVIKYLIWKKLSRDYVTTDYAISIARDKSIHMSTSENLELQEGRLLTIRTVELQDEGLYACISSDGFEENTILYNVVVYVNPTPQYPVIEGCKGDEYCVVEVNREGSLSCSLFGIRPAVDLILKVFSVSDTEKVSWFDQKTKVTEEADTFDIVLTAKYEVRHISQRRLTMECETDIPEESPLFRSTKFEVLLIDPVTNNGNLINTDLQTLATPAKPQFPLIIVLVVVLAFFTITLLIVTFLLKKKKRRKTTPETRESEMQSMLPSNLSNEQLSDKVELFLLQLRDRYKQLCKAIFPIPFEKENAYLVDDLYVEGGIEILTPGTRGRKVWKRLRSYHDILNDSIVPSKFRVIVGDPGYGKSTLGIQLVYDWCNRVPTSPVGNVDVVLFLRFRHLDKVNTLFEAIKLFLVPVESELTVDDIETIIHTTQSVLVIFDGYDEIVDRQNYLGSDIQKIIARTKLQNLHVVVTTRTNCFPEEVKASDTCIRLSGFDEEARIAYIKKAVLPNNEHAAENILQRLHRNPIHADICEIPLLFVMYAHMTHYEETDLQFDSVTSFLKCMISCFHNHFRNKYINEKDRQDTSFRFEMDHNELDEIAFAGLSGDENKLQWSKEEFTSKVGNDIYEYYLRTGILVEEELLQFDNKYGIISSEAIVSKTVVRFFHKLVCEWYASHYLAKSIKTFSESTMRTTLQKVDPMNLQYLYRFACGLSPDHADKIIGYLNTVKDCENLATLCILEKGGTVENMKETIKDLNLETIYISADNSRLLQRSTLQLIDITSRLQIPIKCISLEKCFDSVDPSQRKITLTSGLHFPSLRMVRELKITEMGREITNKEMSDLMKYAIVCRGLKQLTFECCLLPENTAKKLCNELQNNETAVAWNPTGKWYLLGDDAKWKEQEGGEKLRQDDYDDEVQQFRKEWSDMPWQVEHSPTQDSTEN